MLNRMLDGKVKSRWEGDRSREEHAGLGMLPQQLFLKLLCLERKRAERSGRRFVLMLLDPGRLLQSAKARVMQNVVLAISQSTRDTDLKGWYKDGAIVGVIFTEVVGGADKEIGIAHV